MVALVLSGEEKRLQVHPWDNSCFVSPQDLRAIPPFAPLPWSSQPVPSPIHKVPHYPDNRWPRSAPRSHLAPCKANAGLALASTLGSASGLLGLCGLASWLSKCTSVPERDRGATGHPWHRTYEALRFPCPWPGSLLPCHLVTLPLFIHVPAAGVGGKCVLCNKAESLSLIHI